MAVAQTPLPLIRPSQPEIYPAGFQPPESSFIVVPTGKCLCGEIRLSCTDEPVFTVSEGLERRTPPADSSHRSRLTRQAIRHCHDCRRMSNFQTFQVPKQTFRLEAGTPKVYTKVSDFGRIGLQPCHGAMPGGAWLGRRD